MNESSTYIRSRVASIRSMISSILAHHDLPMEVSEFANAAELQARLLDEHVQRSLRNPAEFVKRRCDRGYMGPNTLPFSQTIMLGIHEPAPPEPLTFERGMSARPAPPIGVDRRKK